MKKLFFIVFLMGIVYVLETIPVHADPPGGGDPYIPDPVERAKYQQWQAQLKAGPYFKQVSRALPLDSELSGYIVKREVGNVGSAIKAIRRRDKAELTINVMSSPNSEIMKYHSESIWRGDSAMDGPYPEGSPSGKPLGQSSTQNIDLKNGALYDLQVVDGPTQLNFRLMAHLNSDGKSQYPTWKPITKTDQLFLEHLARIMLRRLKTLKLTHDTFKP